MKKEAYSYLKKIFWDRDTLTHNEFQEALTADLNGDIDYNDIPHNSSLSILADEIQSESFTINDVEDLCTLTNEM